MRPDRNPESKPSGPCAPLTRAERTALLHLARDTLDRYVRTGRRPDPDAPAYGVTPRLQEKHGAFVTLKKDGKLRGCIGYIHPSDPLVNAVQENTVNACSRDTRFSPVEPDELEDIHVEISVLSVPVPVPSYGHIEIGRHGIVLKSGSRRAVFLPQVAVEQGWDLEETLRQLAQKAGLASGAWNASDTEYEVFTAEVIEEEHPS